VATELQVTTEFPFGPSYFEAQRKSRIVPELPRPPRILYVLYQYPQLSETYVETEIRFMRRLNVEIEVWAECQAASPYEPSVPVHRGGLADAIASFEPDVLHVHWLRFATARSAMFAITDVPVTLRAHGFETTDETIRQVLALPTLRRAFCFPHQLASFTDQPLLRPLTVAFDTSLFRPAREKDRRLVVRAGVARPSKDLQLFSDVAAKLPEHRFVLAIATVNGSETFARELVATCRSGDSHVDLMIDVPRDELLPLFERAGIHLHTVTPPDQREGTPLGMPISIAESMATGAYVLVRDLPPLTAYVGDAGRAYRDAAHAAELIAETATWSDAEWKLAWTRSVNRAFTHHADELVLQPLFDEWCSILLEKIAL
jgi:glycosyltransferase involved in cell wall biosynthesis